MFLEVQEISKSFGNETIVEDLNFSLQKHRTLSVLGKSGCGKTTMLKLLAGLVKVDSGEIWLGGQKMNSIRPERRNTVYLYQEDLLFPHLNAYENIAFGLRLKNRPEKEIARRVNEMISSLELSGQSQKMPHQLSGGQRQRVSFGRAMVTNPSLLLLDEPFGSLDAGTRKRMQELYKKLAQEFQTTAIFVTHDLKEAVMMGDEIGLMKSGSLHIYADRNEFIKDPQTGVKEEMEFWNKLKT